MKVDDLQGKSVEDLIQMLDGRHPNDAPSVQIREMIGFRLAAMQAEASGQLVASTERLVGATRGLGRATLALVAATVVLVIVAAVQAAVMWWRP
jgi:hypothetical protein